MIVLEEILIANGITILMMWFLLDCRRKNRENLHTEDKIYDGMVIANLVGALLETIAFLVDGKDIVLGRQINYISNSLCFLGTVTIGMLWCFYVDLRIYRNYNQTFRHKRWIFIPWIIEILAIIVNLFGTGVLFKISSNNVYERGVLAVLGYISLMIYFVYSIYLVYHSKKEGINLNFFPVFYFVGPCLAGVLIQFLFYGITSSWISVAIALTFVQMQNYAENLYIDELSGLYNRRYLNGVLGKNEKTNKNSLYGIMMDVNDFKLVNDRFGHNEGDRALCKIGDLLFKSIPSNAIAIRYAGDEFIILLFNSKEEQVKDTINEITQNLMIYNDSKEKPYALSLAMGYTKFEDKDDASSFLNHMDKNMYIEKDKYHASK